MHLKSVILHRSASRFRDSQGGIKTLNDEKFGSHPLNLIVIICSDYIWNQSSWSQEYLSSHFPDEGFREGIRELVESERGNKRVEAENLQVERLWIIWEPDHLQCQSQALSTMDYNKIFIVSIVIVHCCHCSLSL